MKSISIIGCGWLGTALAKRLLNEGLTIKGSTTGKEKLDQLKKIGIDASLFKLNPMPEGVDFQKLFESEILFINIPPNRRKNSPEFYKEQIKYLKYLINNSSKVKRVIFISSTSYYPNTDENVNENSSFDIDNGSNEAVVWAEKEISQIKPVLIILRCGGLMGFDRIPGKWFSGKETQGRDNPTNYIHRDDIIHKINELIVSENWPKIMNLVNPAHYTRGEIVAAMAKKHGFELPKWVAPYRTPTKIVKSQYSLQELVEPLDY